MTETQDWRTLPAGPELDSLVATALGWFRNPAAVCDGTPMWSDGTTCYSVLPAFSGQPGAAWEVVEAMEKRDWLLILTRRPIRPEGIVGEVAWFCEFWTPLPGFPRGNADARTAPLAICRAAMAALEVAP